MPIPLRPGDIIFAELSYTHGYDSSRSVDERWDHRTYMTRVAMYSSPLLRMRWSFQVATVGVNSFTVQPHGTSIPVYTGEYDGHIIRQTYMHPIPDPTTVYVGNRWVRIEQSTTFELQYDHGHGRHVRMIHEDFYIDEDVIWPSPVQFLFNGRLTVNLDHEARLLALISSSRAMHAGPGVSTLARVWQRQFPYADNTIFRRIMSFLISVRYQPNGE